jgi:hypothetical protein
MGAGAVFGQAIGILSRGSNAVNPIFGVSGFGARTTSDMLLRTPECAAGQHPEYVEAPTDDWRRNVVIVDRYRLGKPVSKPCYPHRPAPAAASFRQSMADI